MSVTKIYHLDDTFCSWITEIIQFLSFFPRFQLRNEKIRLKTALPFHHSSLLFIQVDVKLKTCLFITSVLQVETARQMFFVHLYITLTGTNTREVLKRFRLKPHKCILDMPVLLLLESRILIRCPGSPPAGDESTLRCLSCAPLPSCPHRVHTVELCCF